MNNMQLPPHMAHRRNAMCLSHFLSATHQPLLEGKHRHLNLYIPLTMVVQVGRELIAMHDYGRVHGAVTPANIRWHREHNPAACNLIPSDAGTNCGYKAGCKNPAYTSMTGLQTKRVHADDDRFALVRLLQDLLLGTGMLAARMATKKDAIKVYTAMKDYVMKPLDKDDVYHYTHNNISRGRIAALGHINGTTFECAAVVRHYQLMEQPGFVDIIDPVLTLIEEGLFASKPPTLMEMVARLEAIRERAKVVHQTTQSGEVYHLTLHQADNVWPPAPSDDTVLGDLGLYTGVAAINLMYLPKAKAYELGLLGGHAISRGDGEQQYCEGIPADSELQPSAIQCSLQQQQIHIEENRLVHLAELHQQQREAWGKDRTGQARGICDAGSEHLVEAADVFSPISCSVAVVHARTCDDAAGTVPSSPIKSLVRGFCFPSGIPQHPNTCFTFPAPAAFKSATPQLFRSVADSQRKVQVEYGSVSGTAAGHLDLTMVCSSTGCKDDRVFSPDDHDGSTPDGCVRVGSHSSVCGAAHVLSSSGSSCCSDTDTEACGGHTRSQQQQLPADGMALPAAPTHVSAGTGTGGNSRERRRQRRAARTHGVIEKREPQTQERQAVTHECDTPSAQGLHPSFASTVLTGKLGDVVNLASQVGRQLQALHASGHTHGNVCADQVNVTWTSGPQPQVLYHLKSAASHATRCSAPAGHTIAGMPCTCDEHGNEDAAAFEDGVGTDILTFTYMLVQCLVSTTRVGAHDTIEEFYTDYNGFASQWRDDESPGHTAPPLLLALLSVLPPEQRQQHLHDVRQQMSQQCWDAVFGPLLHAVAAGLHIAGSHSVASFAEVVSFFDKIRQTADSTGLADCVACPVVL